MIITVGELRPSFFVYLSVWKGSFFYITQKRLHTSLANSNLKLIYIYIHTHTIREKVVH